ncbi:MAG: alginate lyase family protein [Phycisphaerae bacterium]|nr:alginate lyase family protein [Phycisphaerae bacterium]
MSPPEVWWRLGNKFQEVADRCAAPLRRRPIRLDRIAGRNGQRMLHDAGALGASLPEERQWDSRLEAAKATLLERAERLRHNRLTLFDLDSVDLGAEVNWNFEWKAGKATPVGFSGAIDYRDYRVTGDCKFVWEPNRHQQLVTLGRAYRATGDDAYAKAVVRQLESWMRQCPFGTGMNWRSPLELAIRLINWVWALELIRPSGHLTSAMWARILPMAYRHLWDVSRKYSRYSSANNHLIGEAAGVFIGSTYFAGLCEAAGWRDSSFEILVHEIEEQTGPDGGHRELAMGYHLFVLEFFLLAGLAGRRAGHDFPQAYWDRLEKMFEYVAAFAEGGDTLPMTADCDDGYVLDLGQGPARARGLLAIGAVLFDREDFRSLAADTAEPVYWLFGSAGLDAFERLADATASDALTSHALPDAGYFVLQSGRRNSDDRISVTFDCGPFGFRSIAAHAHADALSFTLRAFGVDVLVDPGTYDYFTYPAWRDYFRSTRAHNTVMVDDQEQAEMLGPFQWGRGAIGRCVRWEPSRDGGLVCGEHDGYMRLPDPVVHRRTITLTGDCREVIIKDEVDATGDHAVAMYLHFGERCQVHEAGDHEYLVRCERGNLLLRVDSGLAVRLYTGSEDPILGWVSRGYHRKEVSTTLVGRCAAHGACRWTTRISVGPARSECTSAARQTMVSCDGAGQEATEVGRHGK